MLARMNLVVHLAGGRVVHVHVEVIRDAGALGAIPSLAVPAAAGALLALVMLERVFAPVALEDGKLEKFTMSRLPGELPHRRGASRSRR